MKPFKHGGEGRQGSSGKQTHHIQEEAAAELMVVGSRQKQAFSWVTLSLNLLDFSALTLFTTCCLYVEGQLVLCEWGVIHQDHPLVVVLQLTFA